jgi:hypothetical protein
MAMLVAFIHVVFFLPKHSLLSSSWEKTVVLFAIILPAAGAALGGIRSHREYSRIEKRSSNMVHVLTELKSLFEQVRTPENLEFLLRQTEELMLRETQDWLMMMRFIDLKPMP